MKANANLVAGIYAVLFILVLSLVYNFNTTRIRTDCVQSLVKNGSPALEAAKACN